MEINIEEIIKFTETYKKAVGGESNVEDLKAKLQTTLFSPIIKIANSTDRLSHEQIDIITEVSDTLNWIVRDTLASDDADEYRESLDVLAELDKILEEVIDTESVLLFQKAFQEFLSKLHLVDNVFLTYLKNGMEKLNTIYNAFIV